MLKNRARASHASGARTTLAAPTGGHVWVGHDEEIWREVKAFLAPLGGDALARSGP